MNLATRRFGRTEIQMPIFSCGGMRYQQSWDRSASAEVSAEGQKNLVLTLQRALDLGINHFETAHAYGTSEYQMGQLLPSFKREDYILQSKVQPKADPREFLRDFEDSLRLLQVDYLDLLGIHGINNEERLAWTLKTGGCLDIAKQLKKEGRIKHIGFSTHGSSELITRCIQSGEFDYVNLHWYYFMQRNLPALEEAAKLDMGIFIISPSDKGGRLYDPPQKLQELCAPLDPMVFNDLFCLQNPLVHTLSIGASRPSDFDTHMKSIALLDNHELIKSIHLNIHNEMLRYHGANWMESWDRNLPEIHLTPGEINLYDILRFYNMGTALDMTAYGSMRYALLGQKDHWFPGERASLIERAPLLAALTSHAMPEQVIRALQEAHRLFDQQT